MLAVAIDRWWSPGVPCRISSDWPGNSWVVVGKRVADCRRFWLKPVLSVKYHWIAYSLEFVASYLLKFLVCFQETSKKDKVGQVSVRIFRDFARVATPRFFGMKVLSYFRDPNLYFGFSKHFAAEIQKEKAFLEFGNQIFFWDLYWDSVSSHNKERLHFSRILIILRRNVETPKRSGNLSGVVQVISASWCVHFRKFLNMDEPGLELVFICGQLGYARFW